VAHEDDVVTVRGAGLDDHGLVSGTVRIGVERRGDAREDTRLVGVAGQVEDPDVPARVRTAAQVLAALLRSSRRSPERCRD
jgi:hypothetical protein